MIRGDADFTPENGVIAGTGTSEDPFLIAGWTVRVPKDSPFGIYLANTTKAFVLRGCVVVGAQDPNGAAIVLENVQNGVIEDCLVRESINGIVIQSSRDLVLRDNFLGVSGLGLQVLGTAVEHYRHGIEPTTTVNGKPVFYFFGLENAALTDLDAGNIVIAGSAKRGAAGSQNRPNGRDYRGLFAKGAPGGCGHFPAPGQRDYHPFLAGDNGAGFPTNRQLQKRGDRRDSLR
jgi:hypothetical protein